MIKLTTVPSEINTNRNIVLIPGGPGLSSNTLRNLDLLKKFFHLHYVDFQGTNGTEYSGKKTFDELADLLLEKIKTIQGEVYLLGHSFGGFFAADLVLQHSFKAIICLATPFSLESVQNAIDNYGMKKDSILLEAEEAWNNKPSRVTFNAWLSSYRNLYFNSNSSKTGETILRDDLSSPLFFADNSSDMRQMESLLPALRKWTGKKIFIAGSEDGLINTKQLQKDASRANFDFFQIENANHFMMIDQPEIVARLIENVLRQKEVL